MNGILVLTAKLHSGILPRWEIIKRAFSNNAEDSYALERMILQYNPHYANRWDFAVLHGFFQVKPGMQGVGSGSHLVDLDSCVLLRVGGAQQSRIR